MSDQEPLNPPAPESVPPIKLSNAVWNQMEKNAALDGISRDQAYRRAAWLYLFIRERQRQGGCLVFEFPDDRPCEVVIFPYP